MSEGFVLVVFVLVFVFVPHFATCSGCFMELLEEIRKVIKPKKNGPKTHVLDP